MQPKAEYPRPQFVRDRWLNLNGEWEFELDPGESGRERGLPQKDRMEGRIMVPFCPESRLSGVEYKDFIAACWYRRTVEVPAEWLEGRLLLHFGAVYYDCEVWVNGRSAGTHRGGYSSFSLDIRDLARPGENTVTVCARSDLRSDTQPSGKQAHQYASNGCVYTRTTGIWQTVWMEPVPERYLRAVRLTPDPANGRLHIRATLPEGTHGCVLSAQAFFQGKAQGATVIRQSGMALEGELPLEDIHPWSPEDPVLYDLSLTLTAPDNSQDRVDSYFGLRSVGIQGRDLLLNGKPVFQRLVLDQGYYPEGIITAPSDEEMKGDILRAKAMGFNGARLHQKIFEPRFLYWADRLGYLVWGEQGNWGLDVSRRDSFLSFWPEWAEAMERDYSSPALVGWCPLNETQSDGLPEVVRGVYRLTKQLDPTRPVIDTSGWVHCGETDVMDYHNYDQDPETFRRTVEACAGAVPGELSEEDLYHNRTPYGGQPVMISEFGGIWWNPGQQGREAWGYGQRPEDEETFLTRFKGLMDALLETPGLCGFCYTQLTDVEQEVNGLYTYDRRPKFDPAVIRKMVDRPAANETGAAGPY